MYSQIENGFNNISINNTVNNHEIVHYENVVSDLILLTLYLITAIVGLFGNIIVCKVIFNKRQFKTNTTYLLIANLAISDIIGCLMILSKLLFCSHYLLQSLGYRVCSFMLWTQMLSYYVTTFTLTTIAFDRFKIVYYPLSPRLRPIKLIVFIWIISSKKFFSQLSYQFLSHKTFNLISRFLF